MGERKGAHEKTYGSTAALHCFVGELKQNDGQPFLRLSKMSTFSLRIDTPYAEWYPCSCLGGEEGGGGCNKGK